MPSAFPGRKYSDVSETDYIPDICRDIAVRRIINMLRKLQAALLGWLVAGRIIRKNPGRTMVYTLEKVGDQCYELSYINAFKKQHGLANVSVLTTNPDHPLLKIYRKDFDDIIRISRWEYSILFEFYKLDIGQVFRTRHPQIFSTYLTTYIRNDLLRNNLYLNNAQIVKSIYRIPLDTPPSETVRVQKRDKLERLIREGTIVPGRTVIMNPYAVSCSEVPISFFERIARMLQHKGLCVITSVIPGQEQITGTEGVNFSLEETYSFSKECGYIVAARSGFLDLAIHSGAVIASVDSAEYLYSDCYRLEGWDCNENVRTFRHVPGHEEEGAQKITEFILGKMGYKYEP